MNPFCVERLAANPHLRARHGVLRAAGLALTNDARQAAALLLAQARGQAASMLAQAERDGAAIAAAAQAEADRLLAEARARAARLNAAETERVLVQGAALLQGLEQANAAILERVEEMVAGLATALYERLVMETTARERIDAALRRVLLEAPPKLVDAQLRVHPDDAALLPALDWPVKPDPALAPGACRLEAANGQWCASFDAAMQAVKTAFGEGIAETRRLRG